MYKQKHPYDNVLFCIRDKNLTEHQKTQKILDYLYLKLDRSQKMTLIHWLKDKKK